MIFCVYCSISPVDIRLVLVKGMTCVQVSHEEAYKIKAQNVATEGTAKALADQPVVPSARMKKLISAEAESSVAKAMKIENKS